MQATKTNFLVWDKKTNIGKPERFPLGAFISWHNLTDASADDAVVRLNFRTHAFASFPSNSAAKRA